MVDANGAQVVSTNQSQYPTAKAVSLSVANLPQQTAAIPLIIGQQQQQHHQQHPSGSGISISASPAYGYAAHHHQQQHQPTATLLSSINQAAVLSSNGFQLTTAAAGSSASGGASVVGGPGSVPAITAGITRIVDSAGNILHLPSGTAAAAVNSGSGTTFSTLVRVNGNGSVDPGM